MYSTFNENVLHGFLADLKTELERKASELESCEKLLRTSTAEIEIMKKRLHGM